MSYDLYLVDLGPGSDLVTALATLDEARPPGPDLVAKMRKIVAALDNDGYEYNDTGTQILNERLGATVDIAEPGATVNIAYWHRGEDARKAMASVIGLAGAIQQVTGWSLYDPQSDRLDPMLSELQVGASAEMDRVTRWADQNIRGTKRPWWRFWG
ncbi:MAG: hypothetical protein HKN91_10325 [Acidimicrobiia bacterium]|nr:hypothetical protein [Acidimicrobiia bacterium]